MTDRRIIEMAREMCTELSCHRGETPCWDMAENDSYGSGKWEPCEICTVTAGMAVAKIDELLREEKLEERRLF